MGLFSKNKEADDNAVMASAIVTIGAALQALYEGNNREFNSHELWEVLYESCEVLIDDSPEFTVDFLKYQYDTRQEKTKSNFKFNVKESYQAYADEINDLSSTLEIYGRVHPDGNEFQKEIPDWVISQLNVNNSLENDSATQMYAIGLTMGLRLMTKEVLTYDSRTRSRTNKAMAKLISLLAVSWWDRV